MVRVMRHDKHWCRLNERHEARAKNTNAMTEQQTKQIHKNAPRIHKGDCGLNVENQQNI